MVRIFASLAVFALALLTANFLLGLLLGDFGESTQRYAAAETKYQALRRSESSTKAEIEAAKLTRNETVGLRLSMQERFRPHFWLGVASGLVAVLVNCISITYFIGTSRWCREVVEAYGLEWQFIDRSRRLKRWSFPFAILGMLTTLGIAASGAAADPAALRERASAWVIPHATIAMLGLVTIAIAFYVQVKAVAANYQIIQEIMAEALRIRSAKTGEPEGVSPRTSVAESLSGG